MASSSSRDKIRASRFLALLLRHQPELGNLVLDRHGWAPTVDVLQALKLRGHAISSDALAEIVAEDEKQRYAFKPNNAFIRANQGHSIAIDLGLIPLEPPETLFHGTASQFLDAIYAEGLRPMRRQYVHLSLDQRTAHQVGSRHGKCVILTLPAKNMFANGHAFYRSENSVWLTPHVPAAMLTIAGHFDENETII